MLEFKDSTRHYTGPGRQLPFVTTVAVSCSQIAYLGLLNYMRLLKLRSISRTQTSTFPSTLTSASPAGRTGSDGAGREKRAAQSCFPLERRCSCDFWPSKVSLQHCIFSSDGSQDGQIMRSQAFQSQTVHCARLGNRHTGTESLSRYWLLPSSIRVRCDSSPV